MIGKFPKEVVDVIEKMASGIPLTTLSKHFQSYSQGYREGKGSQHSLPSSMGKLCYLATRMPATFAAVQTVLLEAQSRIGEFSSLLDLGAGPGTTLLAAETLGWNFESATLVEKNREFIELGKTFVSSSALWKNEDFLKSKMFSPHDLVSFSYSLVEVPEEQLKKILTCAWEATQKALIIVEPGTPRAFQKLLVARDYLIDLGAHVIAPCPHSRACPMPKNDWCHFAARVERTSLHRKIKGGELGYEDEKFSYMVLGKNRAPTCTARILRAPQKKTGHISLVLCTDDGIQQKTVSKKDGDLFRSVKKMNWGDCLN